MWPAASRTGSHTPRCTSVKYSPIFMFFRYSPSSPTLPIRVWAVRGAISLVAMVLRTAPVMLARNAA